MLPYVTLTDPPPHTHILVASCHKNALWSLVITPDGVQSFLAETCSLIRTECSAVWTDDHKTPPNERSPEFLTFRGSHSGKAPTVTLMWSARNRQRNVVRGAERVGGL